MEPAETRGQPAQEAVERDPPKTILSDTVLFEALDGVLSIEYWISLRRDQQLSISRARDVVRLAVRKLIATG